MNPDETHSLVEIFRRALDEVSILHNLLQQESQVLARRQDDEIKSVAAKKQESVIRIQQQINLQNRFLESNQFPSGETGLNRFLEQSGEGYPDLLELRVHHKKIIECLKKCKALNEQNGASIELMNRNIRRAIELLRNQGNQPYTYGPDGNTQQIPKSRSRISV